MDNIENPESTAKLKQHVETTMSMLDGAVGRMRKRAGSDYHIDELDGVKHHLTQAKSHLAEGTSMGLGKWNENQKSIQHLSEAHRATQKAHSILKNSDVYATHKESMQNAAAIPSDAHMKEQEDRHSSIDTLSSKPTQRIAGGRHELVPHPEKPGTYYAPGNKEIEDIGPHNIGRLTKKYGPTHPLIQKYNAAIKGTEKERQYDVTKPGSPVVSKNMGFATDAEKAAGKVGQNTAGVVRGQVDPRKKASRGYRQADYAGASSEMGKQNPADKASNVEPSKAQRATRKTREGVEKATGQTPYFDQKYSGVREATKGPSYFDVKKVEDRKKAKRVGQFMKEQRINEAKLSAAAARRKRGQQ